MNPNSRMYPPAPNYEEEPPAYISYGDSNSSYLDDHDSPSARQGQTMRLLPTSADVENDHSADVTSMYRRGVENPFDDDAQ